MQSEDCIFLLSDIKWLRWMGHSHPSGLISAPPGSNQVSRLGLQILADGRMALRESLLLLSLGIKQHRHCGQPASIVLTADAQVLFRSCHTLLCYLRLPIRAFQIVVGILYLQRHCFKIVIPEVNGFLLFNQLALIFMFLAPERTDRNLNANKANDIGKIPKNIKNSHLPSMFFTQWSIFGIHRKQ